MLAKIMGSLRSVFFIEIKKSRMDKQKSNIKYFNVPLHYLI